MPEELQSKDLHYSAEEIAAYFSGEMADAEAILLELHIGSCRSCKDKVEEMNERSEAFFAWTPVAHQQAAAALAPSQGTWEWVRGWWWVPLRSPAVGILVGGAGLVVLLAIWIFIRSAPMNPPQLVKQIPKAQTPSPATNKAPEERRAATRETTPPNRTARPVVAVLLASARARPAGGNASPLVSIPRGGSTVRLDVEIEKLPKYFSALIQQPSGAGAFSTDQITVEKPKDRTATVHISFSSDQVRNGEYVLILGAGMSQANLTQFGTYLFTVKEAPR